jgi:hypothetical protein
VEVPPGYLLATGPVSSLAGSLAKGFPLLYVSPNEQAIAQAIGMVVGYDAAKDFAPFARFPRRLAVLKVNADLKAKAMADLVALANAKAGVHAPRQPDLHPFFKSVNVASGRSAVSEPRFQA